MSDDFDFPGLDDGGEAGAEESPFASDADDLGSGGARPDRPVVETDGMIGGDFKVAPSDRPGSTWAFGEELDSEDERRREVEALTDFSTNPAQDVPLSTLRDKTTGEPVKGQGTVRQFLEVGSMGGDLQDLSFAGLDLRRVEIEATLAGSVFDQADAAGMTIRSPGVERGDLRRTSWNQARIDGLTLVNQDCRGIDFSQVASARHITFQGCDLRQVRLPSGERAHGMRIIGCVRD